MLTTKAKLGIGMLFAFLSILLLSLVAPKVSAEYQDGDFSPYTPEQLYNIADQRLYSYYSEHIGSKWFICIWNITSSSYRCRVWGTKELDTYTFTGNITSSNRAVSSQGCCRVTFDVNKSNGDTSAFDVNRTSNDGQSNYYLDNDDIQHIYCNGCSVIWGNGSASPVVQYDASYYIGSSGFNIQFGVAANGNSLYRGWWVETIPYKVNIQLTYNNQPVVVPVPIYKSYYMDIRYAAILWPRPITHQQNPYWSFTDTLHMIEYMPTNYDGFFDSEHTLSPTSLNTPAIEYNASEWIDPNEELQMVSLSSLMKYIQEDYPNFIFTDFQQDITVSIIGAEDNHTYYSNILRYSQVDFPEDAPPSDPDVPDWFQDLSDMISQYNAEKTFNYLFNLPNSYSPIAKVGSLGALTSIDEPTYDFQPIQDLDSDAMGFFSWLVNLIIDSPVGVLMLFALTFLVVSAVIK